MGSFVTRGTLLGAGGSGGCQHVCAGAADQGTMLSAGTRMCGCATSAPTRGSRAPTCPSTSMRRDPSASWCGPTPSSCPRSYPLAPSSFPPSSAQGHPNLHPGTVMTQGSSGTPAHSLPQSPRAHPSPSSGDKLGPWCQLGGCRDTWCCPASVTPLPCFFPAGHVSHQRRQRSVRHRLRARV